MVIKTSNPNIIRPFLKNIHLPQPNSHKGQNGRVLVIGGSSLFHSASIWAAEIVSHFVDMVHYSSTKENNEIVLSLKKKFRSGMVIPQRDIFEYVEEDDVILLGPGMVRGNIRRDVINRVSTFNDVLKIQNEPTYTYILTKYLLEHYPNKKFVLDAGALQMMQPEWLLGLKTKAIITPHQGEFEKMFGLSVSRLSVNKKMNVVLKQAKKYNCVILLKAVKDFISEGRRTAIVEGGNAGLTKGGTGDLLAGLCAAFYAKNLAFDSCLLASFILKKTADQLFLKNGYWYNIDKIIQSIPSVMTKLIITK